MTTFELEQIRPLRAEIRMDTRRLETLNSEHEGAHWPEKVQEVREIIEDKRRRCVAQLEPLERFVAGIPDSYTRELFTLRYVEGLAWKEVAVHMGGGNTSAGLRMTASRYLKRESA